MKVNSTESDPWCVKTRELTELLATSNAADMNGNENVSIVVTGLQLHAFFGMLLNVGYYVIASYSDNVVYSHSYEDKDTGKTEYVIEDTTNDTTFSYTDNEKIEVTLWKNSETSDLSGLWIQRLDIVSDDPWDKGELRLEVYKKENTIRLKELLKQASEL